jgi:diacylglycerol kinase (ATP)
MQELTYSDTTAVIKEQTTAVLIANPTSGSYLANAHHLKETISFLQEHGWKAELRLTQVAGDAGKLAREAVIQGIDIVVAVGGDGTINEIIQELAGSETALGVLPSGTVNVWAREVGIPLDLAEARELLLTGQIRRIDLGQVNERYFLLMVGIGVDGEVAHAVEKKPAKRFGVIGYLIVAFWLGVRYPAFRVILQLGDRTVKINALQVIIGNTQLYGGAIKYTWQARCDDGLLDICVVRKQSLLGRFAILFDFLLGRKERGQWVHYETEKTIKLHTKKPVAIQVDGDPMGYTNTDTPSTIFSIAPHALKVVVPKHLPAELFTTPTSQ